MTAPQRSAREHAHRQSVSQRYKVDIAALAQHAIEVAKQAEQQRNPELAANVTAKATRIAVDTNGIRIQPSMTPARRLSRLYQR
jgi:hypothetical protein